jgi:hypothetical protein
MDRFLSEPQTNGSQASRLQFAARQTKRLLRSKPRSLAVEYNRVQARRPRSWNAGVSPANLNEHRQNARDPSDDFL